MAVKKSMLSSTKMAAVLERQKVSGLTVRSFCSNEGIAPSTFYYWQKKLCKSADNGRFIPLVVRASGSTLALAPAPGSGTDIDTTPLEITYANGTTLRIKQALDLSALRSLVSLLD